MNRLAPYAKAIIAFVAPGIVALVAGVQDKSPGGSMLTGAEWLGVLAACVLTAAGVYVTPNRDPNGTHAGQSVIPNPRVDPTGAAAPRTTRPRTVHRPVLRKRNPKEHTHE